MVEIIHGRGQMEQFRMGKLGQRAEKTLSRGKSQIDHGQVLYLIREGREEQGYTVF